MTEALTTAFGGDETGKHIAMMAFRGRSRKPEEDMQLFAYNLEALLSRAMPNIEAGDRNTLLKQQFIEGVASTLKKELLQRPNLSYEDTVSIAQQLDLASHISSKQIEGQVNHASSNNPKPPIDQPPFVAQLVENMEVLTRKVHQLAESVAKVNVASTRSAPQGRRGPCFSCGNQGHIASECRSMNRS